MTHSLHVMLGVSEEVWVEFAAQLSSYMQTRVPTYVSRYREVLHQGIVPIIHIDEEDLDYLMEAATAYFPQRRLLAYGLIRGLWTSYLRECLHYDYDVERNIRPRYYQLHKN